MSRGNIDNFGGKANTNGFDKRPHDAKKAKGRPQSMRKDLNKILDADGVLTYDEESIISIKVNGRTIKTAGKKVEVQLSVPERETLAHKLIAIALFGKDSVSLRAIVEIIHQTEGKLPKQHYHDYQDHFDFMQNFVIDDGEPTGTKLYESEAEAKKAYGIS